MSGYTMLYMSQDARYNDEQATERRAQILGIQYTDTSTTTELYFANTIHTPDGGSQRR